MVESEGVYVLHATRDNQSVGGIYVTSSVAGNKADTSLRGRIFQTERRRESLGLDSSGFSFYRYSQVIPFVGAFAGHIVEGGCVICAVARQIEIAPSDSTMAPIS